jgi:hypothetical protein
VIVLIIKNVPSCCVPWFGAVTDLQQKMAEASSSSSSGASSAPAAPSPAAAAPAAAAPIAAATAAAATAPVASSSQTKTAQKTWELTNNIMEVKAPLFSKFFLFFLKLHLHHFSKIKSHKEVIKQ